MLQPSVVRAWRAGKVPWGIELSLMAFTFQIGCPIWLHVLSHHLAVSALHTASYYYYKVATRLLLHSMC